MIEGMVNVFQLKEIQERFMFSALVGALLILFIRGVEGFINILNKKIGKIRRKKIGL
jgi:hypothetical protein